MHKWFSIHEETKIYKHVRDALLQRYPNKRLSSYNSLLTVAAKSESLIANISPFLDFPTPTANIVRPVAGITVPNRKQTMNNKLSKVCLNY